MINMIQALPDVKNTHALWCGAAADTNDLIRYAESVIDNDIPVISVLPDSVSHIWTWLENHPTKIIARFDMVPAKGKKSDPGFDISQLSVDVNTSFKRGAHGAAIDIAMIDLGQFSDILIPIRDDLFFNKELLINLDLNEVHASEWPNVFGVLDNLRADGLVLSFNDNKKAGPEFVGRVYGFVESLTDEFNHDIYFAIGNDHQKIEQVSRLIEKLRPKFLSRLKFFIQF